MAQLQKNLRLKLHRLDQNAQGSGTGQADFKGIFLAKFGAQQPGGINQAARIGSSTAVKSSEETNHTEAQQKIPTTVASDIR